MGLLAASAAADAPDNFQKTPLHEAAFSGSVSCVRLLLAVSAALEAGDSWGRKPLHWAAAPNKVASGSGHREVAEALLQALASVHARTRGGCTALHTAFAYGPTDIVEILIAAKANAGDSDERGQSPLHWAAKNGRAVNAQLLLQHG